MKAKIALMKKITERISRQGCKLKFQKFFRDEENIVAMFRLRIDNPKKYSFEDVYLMEIVNSWNEHKISLTLRKNVAAAIKDLKADNIL